VLNPNDVQAHLKIAEINFYIKNYPEAFKSINTVLRIDVYNYDAYFLKGMCYKDMSDTVSAISSFETASRIAPEKPSPYMQLALINSNKDFKKAILYFENCYQADTNNVEPLNGIGIIYQQRKQNLEAKKAFIRCIETQPSYAKAFYNIGCVLMDEDSLPKAQRQFDFAIKSDPKYVEAYFNRGLCKENLKDAKGALEDYEQALNLDPDFQLAIDAKKRLSK
jgi:tetratricopeptide (TPR) repeat protein